MKADFRAVFDCPAGAGWLNALFNAAYHDRRNPMWNRSFMGKHAAARRLRGVAKRVARGKHGFLPA